MPDLRELSDYLWHHPEYSFHEFKACKAMSELLRKYGFQVETGVGGIETSVKAVYDSGKPGLNVGFVGEFDAFPGMGHACGHNLIGTSAAGAGVVLKQVMEQYGIGGKLRVIGTPAEENGSGKIVLLEDGVFSDVDMALIMHPNDVSIADDISFAAVNRTYTFTGKPAHSAACPWVGADAMSAVNLMFTAVDSQRVHCKDYTRIHGIVLEGGTAVNIITEKASCQFNIRALDYEYMEQLVQMVDRCAKGAALCAGVEVSIKQDGYAIKNVKNDKRLVSLVEKNMDFIGEHHIPRELTQGIGSTDVGNVTHAIPSAQFYIGLKENIGTHTAAFARAAGGPEGRRALDAAVKVLAMTGLDVLISEI